MMLTPVSRWSALVAFISLGPSIALVPLSVRQNTVGIHQCLPATSGKCQGNRIATTALCSTTNPNVRFLGKGSHAVVRPGTVLVAPKDEFHHFYRQAAIFIYAMGEDEDAPEHGRYLIRGAIIDHPTPFTIGEMAQSTLLEGIRENPMAGNLIYRGGDKGGDNVFMLHNQEAIGDGDMIGTSGIFQGGLQEALEACQQGRAEPEDFKFFFNFVQFTEEELESMLEGDPWIAVEVPSSIVLSTEWDRGDCWRQLRNALREDTTEDTLQSPEEGDPYE